MLVRLCMERPPPAAPGCVVTCSAHFFAGRPLDDIKRVELVDVEGLGYPDPVIDEKRRLVTATDTTGKIVRTAVFRDTMGCTILPPHWTTADIGRLPYVPYAPAPDVSMLPFMPGALLVSMLGGDALDISRMQIFAANVPVYTLVVHIVRLALYQRHA